MVAVRAASAAMTSSAGWAGSRSITTASAGELVRASWTARLRSEVRVTLHPSRSKP